MRWTTRMLSLLCVGVIAVLGWGAAPTHADPSADPTSPAATTWTIRPDGSEGRISLRHTADPGAVIDDRVVVTNFGPDEATFRLYAGDGVVGADGAFDLAPGEEPTDAGTWIAVGADAERSIELHLAAQESAVVPVSITIPENASPGDHPAGIVAELVPADESESLLTSRVGVRVHLRVTGTSVGSLAVTSASTTWSPSWNPFAAGSVQVDLTLTNTGNVRVGSDTTVDISGPFGLAGSHVARSETELLPGQEATATIEVPVWGLIWSSGQVSATPVTIGEDASPDVVESDQRSVSLLTVEWSYVLIVVLVAGAIVGWRYRRRSREAKVQARIDAAVAAATRSGTP